jgi:hypothetical protein
MLPRYPIAWGCCLSSKIHIPGSLGEEVDNQNRPAVAAGEGWEAEDQWDVRAEEITTALSGRHGKQVEVGDLDEFSGGGMFVEDFVLWNVGRDSAQGDSAAGCRRFETLE